MSKSIWIRFFKVYETENADIKNAILFYIGSFFGAILRQIFKKKRNFKMNL